jgi:hypothetical protein
VFLGGLRAARGVRRGLPGDVVSESDERYTPEHVLDVVRDFAADQIALDPCAPAFRNVTRARVTFNVEQDGLAQEWSHFVPGGSVAFVNPPYSRGQLIKWADKCVRERELERIALIPSDLGSKAGALAAATADALCFVRGRLAFGSPEGQLPQGAKQPSVLVYWGDRAKRFQRIFDQLGTVWRR